MIDHLLHRKVDHWDCIIRELTAKTLHNLASRVSILFLNSVLIKSINMKAPEYMVTTVLPTLFEKTNSIDLNSKHGAVLAIGEIVHALSITAKSQPIEDVLTTPILDKIKNLVPHFRQKFAFRGLGGELMRNACCDFIAKCSLASLALTNDVTGNLTSIQNHKIDIFVVDDWLNLLNECISYNVPTIQSAAIKALPVLLSKYYYSNKAAQKHLVDTYIHELASTSQQEVRMGHALALGALPKFMLTSHLSSVIGALVQAAQITPITSKWAESRRDSIKALAGLAVTMADEIGEGREVWCT